MRNGISRVAKRHIAVVVMACCSLAASAQGEAIDDVMQHVPMATTYLLRTCGVKSQSDTWVEFMASTGASYVLAAGVAYGLKHSVKEWRPDESDSIRFLRDIPPLPLPVPQPCAMSMAISRLGSPSVAMVWPRWLLPTACVVTGTIPMMSVLVLPLAG